MKQDIQVWAIPVLRLWGYFKNSKVRPHGRMVPTPKEIIGNQWTTCIDLWVGSMPAKTGQP